MHKNKYWVIKINVKNELVTFRLCQCVKVSFCVINEELSSKKANPGGQAQALNVGLGPGLDLVPFEEDILEPLWASNFYFIKALKLSRHFSKSQA